MKNSGWLAVVGLILVFFMIASNDAGTFTIWEKVFYVSAGLFCIGAAVWNPDFFFNNSRASGFTYIFGRDGARLFYFILGIFIIVISLK